MRDCALVLNAGSSSLKFCVFERSATEDWHLESRGQIEGIGTAPRITARDADAQVLVDRNLDGEVRDQRDALESLAGWLRSMYGGSRVLGVGHRVVHGGSRFKGPTVITPEVLAELHRLTPLAPLHQPYNLAAIEAVSQRLPDVPQVACFDTSFHRTQSSVAELIPLPREIRRAGVQRYGFHGLSYEYIATRLPEVAPEIARGRVIVAHLGSGASLCALKNGKSLDCSLGFTALDGLCMGTRPGALDPGVILYLFDTLGLTPKEVTNILYKKSGLLGISGISSDMRDLMGNEEPNARLAIDYFVYRASKEIGAMAAALGGVDGLVFTAGVGENSPEIRERVCQDLDYLGLRLDFEKNRDCKPDVDVAAAGSPARILVIATREDLTILREIRRLLRS